jgi:hypothetical protein
MLKPNNIFTGKHEKNDSALGPDVLNSIAVLNRKCKVRWSSFSEKDMLDIIDDMHENDDISPKDYYDIILNSNVWPYFYKYIINFEVKGDKEVFRHRLVLLWEETWNVKELSWFKDSKLITEWLKSFILEWGSASETAIWNLWKNSWDKKSIFQKSLPVIWWILLFWAALVYVYNLWIDSVEDSNNPVKIVRGNTTLNEKVIVLNNWISEVENSNDIDNELENSASNKDNDETGFDTSLDKKIVENSSSLFRWLVDGILSEDDKNLTDKNLSGSSNSIDDYNWDYLELKWKFLQLYSNKNEKKLDATLDLKTVKFKNEFYRISKHVFENIDNFNTNKIKKKVKGKDISVYWDYLDILNTLFPWKSLQESYEKHYKFIVWLNAFEKWGYILKIPWTWFVNVMKKHKEEREESKVEVKNIEEKNIEEKNIIIEKKI